MTTKSSRRAPGTSGRKASPSPWMLVHLVPVAVLAVPLLGLIASDFIRDLKKAPQVEVLEEQPGAKRTTNNDPVAQAAPKAQVLDEPDEIVVLPAKFKIDDEPEERLPQNAPVKVEITDEPVEMASPVASTTDKTPLVRYALAPGANSFGISTTNAAGAASNKQLTYSPDGRSNSTVIRIDKFANMLDGPDQFGKPLAGQGGSWTRANVPRLEDDIVPTPYGISPSHSTWTAGGGANSVVVHQVLEIVPGQGNLEGSGVRRQYDTVVIRWIIHNRDKKDHTVGLRLQLDTLIGGNDGVPFTVPSQTGLVTSFADFRTAPEVPAFIQALEVPNLKNPGTVAHVTLKLGSSIEPPDRLSLTRWPAFGFSPWEVPVQPMGNDSAAVLYWVDKPLKAGAKRTIGFSYGLGNVAYSDKLGLTLGGSFEPGQQFTATAYVENPVAGQTVRLELPKGLKRMDGAETQPVPAAARPGAPSLVTWKVEVEQTGTFKLVVHSSTGIAQAKTVSIARPDAGPTGKLAMELNGPFDPGKAFGVVARVGDAVAGQTVTLQLPAGLQLVEGEATQPVPIAALRTADSIVKWSVKVKQAGKFPVRVASSTGIAQTKTITIADQPSPQAANFRIALDGEFSAGKVFTVTAKVTEPVPNQTLTLQLPKGLERMGDAPIQPVPPGPTPTLSWKVKVLHAGKFSLGVASSTGVTQKKSLVIEALDQQAGLFTFDLVGEIRRGKTIDVVARVADPVAGQTLTLTLPKELKLAGSAARQPITAFGAPATITWRVQVLEAGRLPVRVESSTGLVRTKTIVLATETDGALFGR